jgi:hypothetical protein
MGRVLNMQQALYTRLWLKILEETLGTANGNKRILLK